MSNAMFYYVHGMLVNVRSHWFENFFRCLSMPIPAKPKSVAFIKGALRVNDDKNATDILSILFLQVFAVIQFNRKNLLGWTNFLENQRLRRFYLVDIQL